MGGRYSAITCLNISRNQEILGKQNGSIPTFNLFWGGGFPTLKFGLVEELFLISPLVYFTLFLKPPPFAREETKATAKMEKTLYNPLLNYHDDEDAEASIVSNASSHSLRDDWWGRWGKYIIAINIIIPWLLVVACAGILLHYSHPGKDRFRQHKLYPSQLTYSPAQEAIEYKVEVFHQNVESAPSQFQGPPSAELDQAWEDLYQCEFSQHILK